MSEREQLEQAISPLEAQHATLGDVAVDAALAGLRQKLVALGQAEETGAPTLAAAGFFSLEELAALEEPVEAQSRCIAERVLRGEYQVLPPADLQSGTIFTEIAAWM